MTAGAVIGLPAIAADTAKSTVLQCRVQSLAVDKDFAMQMPVPLPANQRPAAIIAANYRRGEHGDWDVPVELDSNSSDARLLLMTPDGPVLIDLSILVNGRSFRVQRKQWIDETLKQARSETESLQNASTEENTQTGGENKDEGEDDSDAIRTVPLQTFELTDALTRLRKYASRPGIQVGRDEARWLLAQWSPGSELLELRPSFAAERSSLAPLWVAIDQNGDHTLAASELNAAFGRLNTMDANEDGLLSRTELMTGRSPRLPRWSTTPLLTVLSDVTNRDMLSNQLSLFTKADSDTPHHRNVIQWLEARGLPNNTDSQTTELERLTSAKPDMQIRIHFGTDKNTDTGVFVEQFDRQRLKANQSASASSNALYFPMPRCDVEISAAQPSLDAGSTKWSGQVAVGAVIDGMPLLRMVDSDNNRQLSVGELESVADILSGLDDNKDGAIQSDELPIPIRLTVTMGANVHRVLSRPAPAQARRRSQNAAPAPDWFRSMDRNRDGDLTAAEFIGTRQQFDRLDQDGNQRVSTVEAVTAGSSVE